MWILKIQQFYFQNFLPKEIIEDVTRSLTPWMLILVLLIIVKTTPVPDKRGLPNESWYFIQKYYADRHKNKVNLCLLT